MKSKWSNKFKTRLQVTAILAGMIAFSSACGIKPPAESKPETPSATASENEKENPQITPLLLPETLSEPRTQRVTHVMLHFTSNIVANPQQPFNIEDIIQIFKDYEVSSHYLISREGMVYELVSENRVAYHAGKGSLPDFPDYKDRLNQFSIGIEMLAVGTRDEMSYAVTEDVYNTIPNEAIGYTPAQYNALNQLLDSILIRNPEIVKDRGHIIGHQEYAKGRKTDPGSLFDWSKIGLEK